MEKQIIPSIIAKNQKELNKRFNKVENLSTKFHLDIMDGKFVKNKLLMFDVKLSKKKRYEAHLMIKNPEKWIKKVNKAGANIFVSGSYIQKSIDGKQAIFKLKSLIK